MIKKTLKNHQKTAKNHQKTAKNHQKTVIFKLKIIKFSYFFVCETRQKSQNVSFLVKNHQNLTKK